MILVDTSIWIGLLHGHLGRQLPDEALEQVVTTGPIIQEVLQGTRSDSQRFWLRQSLLALPRVSDPLPLSTFLEAAGLYSLGRKRGLTIRSTTDCLIAAIAIENNVPVWHSDRDFSAIARFTPLEAFERWDHRP